MDSYFDENEREFHYPQRSLYVDAMRELYESKGKFARDYFDGFPNGRMFFRIKPLEPGRAGIIAT